MAKALHEQAAEYIRTNIQNGTYPIGGQIPTENELTELLGISRPTLRLALERLTQEGLLMRVKGKGTFVRQPKVLHESTRFITGYRAEAEKTPLHHANARTGIKSANGRRPCGRGFGSFGKRKGNPLDTSASFGRHFQ